MPSLEFIRSEIEHMRLQVGRQRKEIYKGQYLTNVINGRAVEDVHQLSGDRPFFLWVTQSAPHVENINANSGGPCGGEAVPPSRDLGRFAGTQLPRLPGVLEQDVSDKPEIVSGQPRISPKQRRVIRHRYECRIETLPAREGHAPRARPWSRSVEGPAWSAGSASRPPSTRAL